MTTSHWKRIMNEDTHLLGPINTKKCPKIPKKIYLATQMKHDQSSYFCRGPDDFCWGPAPVGSTLVTGLLPSDWQSKVQLSQSSYHSVPPGTISYLFTNFTRPLIDRIFANILPQMYFGQGTYCARLTSQHNSVCFQKLTESGNKKNERYTRIKQVSEVIWRRPHRVRERNRDPSLTQCSLAPWESLPKQNLDLSAVFAGRRRVTGSQTLTYGHHTHHAALSVAIVRISCIRCGLKTTNKNKNKCIVLHQLFVYFQA